MVMSFPLRGLVGIRHGFWCEKAFLQIALIRQRVQCWARATVLDVSADVIAVGLAITERLSVPLTGCEKAFDNVNESQMHLVVR
jgi:hypothetical protein